MKRLLSILLSVLFASCGYHWQLHERPTISVPFIVGDDDGALTTEIIDALASSGIANIVSKGALYTLKITIGSNSGGIIGFRIDPQKINGTVIQQLLATEGRRTMSLQASLYRGDELAFGPYTIDASADYDFVDGDSYQDLTFVNPKGETLIVLPYSLGQLEPTESAAEAATRPLYARLAQKIVNVLSLQLH